MAPTAPVPILLLSSGPRADDVARLLEADGHRIICECFANAAGEDLLACQLIVVEGGPDHAEALLLCRRLRARLGANQVPVLFILADGAPTARAACLDAGADAYLLRPFLPTELRAQVQGCLRFHQLLQRLTEQAAEMHTIHQRLKLAQQQIDLEIEAARRLQMSFLPQALPELPGVRFAVHYRPCGRVGGDFYDVFRLDENHVGFYIADTIGHGVPASLLTIFLKRGVCGKEISGKQYRLVPPAEVLARLNRGLLEQRLPEAPYITIVYCLLNFRDGALQMGRAGQPHPLYVPRSGEIQIWQGNGGLLGVCATQFQERTERLAPGDKLILYSDGLEAGQEDGRSNVAEALRQCADKHRGLPIDEYLPRLAHELLDQVRQVDDFTVLGLERAEGNGS